MSRFNNKSAMISGVKVGGEETGIVLFADEMLLLTLSPNRDIPLIQETFDIYHDFAGLQINFTKSEILQLTPVHTRTWLKDCPFRAASTTIRYLGINIGKQP